MAQKDLSEKRLEKLNDVFADMVNGSVFKGKQVVTENDIFEADTESVYTAGGILKEQFRDVSRFIRHKDNETSKVRLILTGFENQQTYDRDMPLRVIGYDGAAYRSQVHKEPKYAPLTLIFYFGETPWGKNRSIYDVIDVRDDLKAYISDYRINIIDIGRLTEAELSRYRSDFRIIAEYTRHRNDWKYLRRFWSEIVHPEETLYTLSALSGNKHLQQLADRKGGEIITMDRVWELMDRRAAAIERAKTGPQAAAAGRARERKKTEAKCIKNAMQNFHITFTEAVKGLDIPESKWDMYRKIVDEGMNSSE